MADVSVLEVLLNGEPIGTLTRVGADRTLFSFNDAYAANEQRPTLGLGFKDETGGLITEFRPVQSKVMPFFSNLLPEGPLRKYLAERAGVNEKREFFLLWVLGRDLPGAVAVRPSDGEAWPADAGEDAIYRRAVVAPGRFGRADELDRFGDDSIPRCKSRSGSGCCGRARCRCDFARETRQRKSQPANNARNHAPMDHRGETAQQSTQ